MEVSIIPCDEWAFRVSLLSVGRIIRQEVRQPGKPTPTALQLAPRHDGTGTSGVSQAQRLSELGGLSTYPQSVMSKDFRKLWKDVINTTDEGKAVRTLAEILVDREGRGFISRLERNDIELCIEILDHVCPDLRLPPSPLSDGFSGYRKTQTQYRREAGFLRHVEETCWMLWTIARFYGNNRKN